VLLKVFTSFYQQLSLSNILETLFSPFAFDSHCSTSLLIEEVGEQRHLVVEKEQDGNEVVVETALSLLSLVLSHYQSNPSSLSSDNVDKKEEKKVLQTIQQKLQEILFLTSKNPLFSNSLSSSISTPSLKGLAFNETLIDLVGQIISILMMISPSSSSSSSVSSSLALHSDSRSSSLLKEKFFEIQISYLFDVSPAVRSFGIRELTSLIQTSVFCDAPSSGCDGEVEVDSLLFCMISSLTVTPPFLLLLRLTLSCSRVSYFGTLFSLPLE
jgi:hypothetical protein